MKKNIPNVLKDFFYVLKIVILFVILYSFILNLLFGGIVIGFLEDCFYLVQGQPKVFYNMRVVESFTVDATHQYGVKAIITQDRARTPFFYDVGDGYVHTSKMFHAMMDYKLYQASLLNDTLYVYVDGKLHIAPVFVEDQVPPR